MNPPLIKDVVDMIASFSDAQNTSRILQSLPAMYKDDKIRKDMVELLHKQIELWQQFQVNKQFKPIEIDTLTHLQPRRFPSNHVVVNPNLVSEIVAISKMIFSLWTEHNFLNKPVWKTILTDQLNNVIQESLRKQIDNPILELFSSPWAVVGIEMNDKNQTPYLAINILNRKDRFQYFSSADILHMLISPHGWRPSIPDDEHSQAHQLCESCCTLPRKIRTLIRQIVTADNEEQIFTYFYSLNQDDAERDYNDVLICALNINKMNLADIIIQSSITRDLDSNLPLSIRHLIECREDLPIYQMPLSFPGHVYPIHFLVEGGGEQKQSFDIELNSENGYVRIGWIAEDRPLQPPDKIENIVIASNPRVNDVIDLFMLKAVNCGHWFESKILVYDQDGYCEMLAGLFWRLGCEPFDDTEPENTPELQNQHPPPHMQLLLPPNNPTARDILESGQDIYTVDANSAFFHMDQDDEHDNDEMLSEEFLQFKNAFAHAINTQNLDPVFQLVKNKPRFLYHFDRYMINWMYKGMKRDVCSSSDTDMLPYCLYSSLGCDIMMFYSQNRWKLSIQLLSGVLESNASFHKKMKYLCADGDVASENGQFMVTQSAKDALQVIPLWKKNIDQNVLRIIKTLMHVTGLANFDDSPVLDLYARMFNTNNLTSFINKAQEGVSLMDITTESRHPRVVDDDLFRCAIVMAARITSCSTDDIKYQQILNYFDITRIGIHLRIKISSIIKTLTPKIDALVNFAQVDKSKIRRTYNVAASIIDPENPGLFQNVEVPIKVKKHHGIYKIDISPFIQVFQDDKDDGVRFRKTFPILHFFTLTCPQEFYKTKVFSLDTEILGLEQCRKLIVLIMSAMKADISMQQ